MNIQDIVVEIDAEISRLQQAKALLAGISTTEMRKPGRPANASSAGKARTRRTLSAEARERIAAAQRARWAKSKKAAKKAASAKVAKKSVPVKKAVPTKTASASKTKAAIAPKAPATPVTAAS